MRFRLCCTCDEEEKPKKENRSQTIESPPQTVLPEVITQQPKHVVEPIQLDRITEVSVEESSVQATKEEQPQLQATRLEPSIQEPVEESSLRATKKEQPQLQATRLEPSIQEPPPAPVPAPRQIEKKLDDISAVGKEDSKTTSEIEQHEKLYKKYYDMVQAAKAARAANPPVAQQHLPVKQESNFTVKTTIDGENLTFSQIAPDLYRGTFKGSQFHIIQGQVQDDYFVFEESDKAAIKRVYIDAMKGMQVGMKELQGGVSALNNQEAWTPPSGSTINTNYFTRNGKSATMTFIAIDGEGHFRSTYEGKEFFMLNGRLLADDSFDEQDRQLISQTYNNTLLGMQQGLLGMQTGMLGMKTGVQSMQMNAMGSSVFAQGGTAISNVVVGGTAYSSTAIGGSAYVSAVGGLATVGVTADRGSFASYNLAAGQETLKRMRSLNHGQRISLLEGGSMAQPRQPVMVIEDITEKFSKKPPNFDDVDGGKLSEPVLQKTTFTPQVIIYDDPKTYEEQDKNELPAAKQLDEYIISLDENFNSENRYHFHQARPKRVIRRKLNPKDKFRLESPERYSLFEEQCLKLHNQYRKMHGVPPLVHNEFLSQVAKEWAEHLALTDAFYHRPNNEYGENLYYVDGMQCPAKMAVKSWYDEIDLYDYDNPKFSREVGHFTQLVWKDTREVGTGVAQIGNKMWVCCNYHPPGNYLSKLNDEFVPRPVMKRVKGN